MHATTIQSAATKASQTAPATADANSIDSLSRDISTYFAWSLPHVGVMLNLFSIFIFTRKSLNKTNMGYLYLWQTCIDIVLLLSYVHIFRRASAVFGYDFPFESNLLCKLVIFFRRFILHASSWLSVYITFDRFVYVYLPSKFAFFKSRSKITMVLALMLGLILLIDIENLFFYLDSKVINHAARKVCTATPFVNALSDMVSITMRTYIPLTLMLVFDVLIIKKLHESKHRSKNITQKKENQYTINVMLLNCIFFLFNFPLSIVYILKNIITFSGIDLPGEAKVKFNFILNLTINIAFLTQSLSFFINLTFNKLYRTEFAYLIRIKRPRSVRNSTMSASEQRLNNS
jgi:hypothetical protein